MDLMNNIPVQMISVINTTGDMMPLKFRYEANDHSIRTVVVTKTMGRQETNYVGQQCIRYLCKAEVDQKETIFEMKYLVVSHRWVISQVLT